jgi:hypothetical protein
MSLTGWWRNRGRNLALYPEDDNGDVLWQMHKAGDDLAKRRKMNFNFLFRDESAARAFAANAESSGFVTDVSYFAEKSSWDAECSLDMVPTHRKISASERQLVGMATAAGGQPDGWGCMSQ